jgi:hypothetical protein
MASTLAAPRRTDRETSTADVAVLREPRVLTPFVRWTALPALALLVLVMALAMLRTDGHWVFVIDDGAIHLSIADTLARHGTWGVTAGTYESASSSPVWTATLAGAALMTTTGREFLPVVANALAGLWILVVLGRAQSVIRPSLRRPLDAVTAVVLAVIVLFLPALAVTGMEHLLHIALLLTVLHVLRSDERSRRTVAIVLGLLALAALVRFETMFFAIGLAIALVVAALPRPAAAVRLAAGCLVATGLPIAAFAAFNRAMGQEWLPNSIVAKSALGGSTPSALVPSAQDTLEAIARDPVVLALALVALAYVAGAWFGGPRAALVPAVAFLVTALLHSAFGDYGWYERYQAYVVALGIYAALVALSEVADPRRQRAYLVAALVAVPLLAPLKWSALYEVPNSSENTYHQRYQLGRFLDRYYDDRPVATGELGYPTLFHDGPVVDLLGLGSHEVLEALEQRSTDAAYWRALIDRRGVEVVAMYPSTLRHFENPPEWRLVGEWTLGVERTSALEERFQFWAPRPDLVAPLRDHLLDFAPELPAGAETRCLVCQGEAPSS